MQSLTPAQLDMVAELGHTGTTMKQIEKSPRQMCDGEEADAIQIDALRNAAVLLCDGGGHSEL